MQRFKNNLNGHSVLLPPSEFLFYLFPFLLCVISFPLSLCVSFIIIFLRCTNTKRKIYWSIFHILTVRHYWRRDVALSASSTSRGLVFFLFFLPIVIFLSSNSLMLCVFPYFFFPHIYFSNFHFIFIMDTYTQTLIIGNVPQPTFCYSQMSMDITFLH